MGVVAAVRWPEEEEGEEEGWVVCVCVGGSHLMAAPSLIEPSDMTKTGLTGWLNGAAVTERLPSASHTPNSRPLSRPALPPRHFTNAVSLVALTYFIVFSRRPGDC